MSGTTTGTKKDEESRVDLFGGDSVDIVPRGSEEPAPAESTVVGCSGLNSALMFSRATDEWTTPGDFYDALDKEFGFNLDAAARKETAKCRSWFGPDHDNPRLRDALAIGCWSGGELRAPTVAFLNPPYSRCAEFVAKADQQRRDVLPTTTVMLIPSRTDTRYWHAHIWDRDKHTPRPGVEVRFVKGRLKFGNSTNSAPFPSVVIIFRPVQ
jgi:phage N-6-adenine-methyltransferase